jgi:broad specificity phosphatase PhoE
MPVLFMVRHGDNDFTGKRLVGRKRSVSLNDHGREQACLVRNSLQKVKFRHIYSSPLERAVETATPLAQAVGKTIELLESLSEVDFGTWTGHSLRTLHRLPEWNDLMTDPDWGFPGGESLPEVRMRVRAMLEEVTSRAGKKDRIIMFTHGDIIRLAMEQLLELPPGGFHKFSVDTASLTILTVHDGKTRLLGFNLKPPYIFPEF